MIFFCLNIGNQKREKEALTDSYDLTQLIEKLSFCRVFCSLNPLGLLGQPYLSWPLALLAFLNYLQYISVFALSNLAILGVDFRTIGDLIYLVATICLVYLLIGPALKEFFIYRHYSFIPTQKFSNIFKQPD